MDTAYHPAFGGPAAYRFEAMPEAPDAQVRMTIRKAVGWALCQCYTPEVQKAAADALELGHGHPVKGVWEAIKPHIRFQQDYDTGQQLAVDDPRKRSIVETMIPPASMAQLIERGTAVEDCDGFTMYGAAPAVRAGNSVLHVYRVRRSGKALGVHPRLFGGVLERPTNSDGSFARSLYGLGMSQLGPQA